jgi:hypothetical protein
MIFDHRYEPQSKLWEKFPQQDAGYYIPAYWDIPMCFAQGIVRPTNFSRR